MSISSVPDFGLPGSKRYGRFFSREYMLRPGSGPPQRGQSSAIAPGKITEAVSNEASNGVQRKREHLFKSDSFAGGVGEFSLSPGERAVVRGDGSFEFHAVLKLFIQRNLLV